MYYRIFSLFLIMILLVPSNVSAENIEDEIMITLNEIDQAREDGADVSDLMEQVNQIVETLDDCGWESCDGVVIQSQLDELHIIQDQARERQNFDYGWIIIIFVIILAILGYSYRKEIYYRIYWFSLAHREIAYEDEYEK